MTIGVTSKVELFGPLFHRDPAKTFRQNVREMLDALAEELEAMTQEDIASHESSMPGWTGWTLRNVVGRTESVSGKRWGTWAVVSENTSGMSAKDAIRSKASASGIERRWHPFRRVKSAVYRSRAVIRADLSEGLN